MPVFILLVFSTKDGNVAASFRTRQIGAANILVSMRCASSTDELFDEIQPRDHSASAAISCSVNVKMRMAWKRLLS